MIELENHYLYAAPIIVNWFKTNINNGVKPLGDRLLKEKKYSNTTKVLSYSLPLLAKGKIYLISGEILRLVITI